jgi:hypothetical protein
MGKLIKKALKIVGVIATVLIGLILIYVLIFRNPGFLFKYRTTYRNLILYSNKALTNSSTNILKDIESRLSKSNVYNSKKNYRIFICNDNNKFEFFSLSNNKQIGGFCRPYLSNNAFIREADIEKDCIFNSYGEAVGWPRTLSYCITHEIAHIVAGEKVGAIAVIQLPVWINEGYSEYIAQETFDFNTTLADFKSGRLEALSFDSHLYDRYHLLISYLLDMKKVNIDDVLANKYKESDVEKELKSFVQ